VRELSRVLGDVFSERKQAAALPFADASPQMLWLKALRCRYSDLPCATPGIPASVCRVLHRGSLLPLLPKHSFPGCKQGLHTQVIARYSSLALADI